MNNSINERILIDRMSSLSEYNLDKYIVTNVLETCERLRHKVFVLNRRLQRIRTENKRLQKRNEKLEELLLDYVARQIPD